MGRRNRFRFLPPLHSLNNILKNLRRASGGNKRSVFVTFPNAEEIKAQIVTYNSSIDVAIIKFESGRILSCAKVQLENVDEARFVIAIGNPYDIDKYYNSVTIGNISYTNRIINEKDVDEKEISNIYIQHTASLNSGSSGGGLYNIKGEKHEYENQ